MGNDFFQSRTLKPCKTCISINTQTKVIHTIENFSRERGKSEKEKQAKQNIKSTTNKQNITITR